MSIESDTLNFNELIHAASVGSQYTNSSESYKQMVAEADNTEELQQVIEEQSGITDSTYENALLIVPSNIDAEIDLHSRYGIYGTLHLNSLKGAFIARDRCLQINNLNAVTDAGDMALTALYATRSKKDIITGFDLELRKVKVDRLISLDPFGRLVAAHAPFVRRCGRLPHRRNSLRRHDDEHRTAQPQRRMQHPRRKHGAARR